MKNLLFLLVTGLSIPLMSQDTGYNVSIDLNNVVDDRLFVEIEVPAIDQDSLEYHLPKIVPGTYSISDFGRFVEDFTALNEKGDTLSVERVSVNRWMIPKSSQLQSITYWMHDTFDKSESYTDNVIFEPGGSSIEADRNVFVMNTFGFVGYLEGQKFNPYQLNITHPESLYGATSLQREGSTKTSDTFIAQNYNYLADAPIMYAEPDTAVKNIAGAEIIISVYSPNDQLSAKEVMDNVDDLMEAQTQYLGGKLPVDRYVYLIYLMDYYSLSGAMGALEHSFSSLYTLPEANADQISKTVRDVAAHEFLHIVTPLNIHSEQIHYFNYIEPEMSRHLWLYEGVTEYSSLHVQVRSELYSPQEFIDEIRQKILVSDQFPEVSFTEMSERILEPEFEPMYSNVYYKGALIGMCLDLHLIKYSEGTMDLPRLMQKLAEKYGPDQPFSDENLIAEITAMTSPEVGQFFENHVVGDEPLPIVECLEWAGVSYKAEEIKYVNTLGNIELDIDDEEFIYISATDEMNDFGKELGFETYDKILTINGREFNLTTAADVLEEWRYDFEEGEKVKVVVSRMVDGEAKEVKLKGKTQKVGVSEKHNLELIESSTASQLQIRDWWFNGL